MISTAERPARLLFVTPWLGTGGIERTLEVTIPWLAQRGHAVNLAAWDTRGALDGGASGLLQEARRAGVGVHRLPSPSFLGVVRQAAALRALVRRHGIRIVVGHELVANVVVSLAKLMSGGRLRVIAQCHNEPVTYASTGASRTLLTLAPALIRRADAIIAVSEHLRNAHAEFLRMDPRGIHRIYNPMPLDQLRKLADVPSPDVDALRPFLVACGRLTAVKGFDDLIRAFAVVRPRLPARLVILGTGPDGPALEALAMELGVAGDVLFPGFVSNPFRYFARAAAFILSSRSEGLANVVLEAMATGTPVITSECGGSGEAIEHGRTGIVYPVADVAALARAMTDVLTRPEWAAELAAEGRRRADGFDAERVLPQFEARYLGG